MINLHSCSTLFHVNLTATLRRALGTAALPLVLVAGMTDAASAQPGVRALSEQEMTDMIIGAGIYCSRGFDTQGMIDKITTALSEGKTFHMIAFDDLPDDWLGFTTFEIGGGGAWPAVIRRYESLNLTVGTPSVTPEQVLSKYIGKEFQTTFSAEAGQLVGSLMTASRLGIPLIDGDVAARCLPEVQMSTFYVNSGITRAPFAGTTIYGDVFIFPKVRDDFRTEDVTRALAIASGGHVRIASNALPGSVLKKNLTPNFYSQAGRLGRAAGEAVAAGKDPVAAVIAAGGGYLLFEGRVTKSESKGEGGFGWTNATLEGTGKFVGSEYRIYNKNENMVAWRDGKLDAAAPDIIAALDPETGWAMRGSAHLIGGFVVGEELAIVGFPAGPLHRTPQMIEAVGPRHFGFDIDYVPIEKLHAKSR